MQHSTSTAAPSAPNSRRGVPRCDPDSDPALSPASTAQPTWLRHRHRAPVPCCGHSELQTSLLPVRRAEHPPKPKSPGQLSPHTPPVPPPQLPFPSLPLPVPAPPGPARRSPGPAVRPPLFPALDAAPAELRAGGCPAVSPRAPLSERGQGVSQGPRVSPGGSGEQAGAVPVSCRGTKAGRGWERGPRGAGCARGRGTVVAGEW